jgi:hypothetical protein
MRFYVRDNEIEVVLSRRNLESGLVKLDLQRSARELQSNDGPDDFTLRLRFEEDEEHYADRPPGPVLGL